MELKFCFFLFRIVPSKVHIQTSIKDLLVITEILFETFSVDKVIKKMNVKLNKPYRVVARMKNKGAYTAYKGAHAMQQTPHPRKPRPYSGAAEHCTFYPYERRVQTASH